MKSLIDYYEDSKSKETNIEAVKGKSLIDYYEESAGRNTPKWNPEWKQPSGDLELLKRMLERGEGREAVNFSFNMLIESLASAWTLGANHEKPSFDELNEWRQLIESAKEIQENVIGTGGF